MKNTFYISLLILSSSVALADTVESGHVKFSSVSHQFTVADDLNYEQEIDFEWKALSDQGAIKESKYPIIYNRVLSSVKILKAETIKANGQRIPVPESGIARQSGAIGQITFKELEVISLAFPDVSAGDSMHIHYLTRNKPLFPGYFHFSTPISENVTYDKVDVRLDVPESLLMNVDKVGFPVERDEIQNGRHIVHWKHKNPVARTMENGRVDAKLTQAHLMVTSFPSWDALAKAYMDRHLPQSVVTEEISSLAKELTAGATDNREKAKRIYDWVRKNIRYVAIYAGLEPWVPHKASEVLNNRFGDCKDHAVLLDALLHAVEIKSVPVLITSDLLNYKHPSVAIPIFNHVITYLPELDLYLDSTSVHTEFGQLPVTDQGKFVLRGGLSKTTDTTPVSNADDRKIQRKSQIRVNENGTVLVETTIRVAGNFRAWFEQFRQEIAGKENVWAKNRLDNRKLRGIARLEFLPEENRQYGFRVTQGIENFLPEGEIGLLAFGHAEAGPVSITDLTDIFEAKGRFSSFACRAVDIEDSIEIILPDNLKFLRLPSNKNIDSKEITLQSNYRKNGSSYTMDTHFRWSPGNSNSCTKQQWAKWRDSMRKVRSTMKSSSLAFEREL